jgi:hypothetical protein
VATREEILKEINVLKKQKNEQIQIQIKELKSFFGSPEKIRKAGELEAEIQKKIYAKYDELKALNSPPPASGQTAEQKVVNDSTTSNPGTGTPDKLQDPQPISAEQKNNLDQANSGQLSSQVEQSQDATAANKQNNSGGTQASPSEANYSGPKETNTASSVTGKNVTSNTSEYRPSTSGISSFNRNVLHDYTSYTYRITLFLLTKQDYNNLAADPTKFVPTFSLISSGAGFASPGQITIQTTRKASSSGGGLVTFENVTSTQTKAGRHPDFQTDFFIDNLSMTTIVGLNAKTKASNAVEIGFDITEPYGLSLLDRLLSACETSGDNNPNYMAQPYLLQVDLLSTPTDEQHNRMLATNNVIVSKKIAVKLLEMKIKPSGSGTTYAVKAIPFNHTAFSMTAAAMPVAMSVTAGTVGDFFSTTDDLVKLFNSEIQVEEERLEQNLEAWVNEYWSTGGYKPTPEEIAARRQALKNAIVYNVGSLTAAYNSYMENISKQQQLSRLPPTKIAFNIPDDEISKSPIVDENTAQNSNAGMNPTTFTVNADNPQVKSTENFNINAGTSIIDIIDQVMGKSQYIKNQLKTQGEVNNDEQAKNQYVNGQERTDDKQQPKSLKWYKIVPTVALNDFDASRNDYSKTILYSILPYTAANAYHPNFPKATAQSVADSVVREYNYLYTGKNADILKLDIDFDSTYYTQLTTYRNQLARLGTNRSSDPNDVSNTQYSFQANSQQNILPQTVQVVGSNKDANSMNTAANPDEKIIGDLKKSIYTSQRGDMLNIKMNIIGDPAFIKQDDIYYNPGAPNSYKEFSVSGSKGNQTVPINPTTGQIIFDAQQVYVRLNVKNAVDINDSIGIVNQQHVLRNGRQTDGTFSGVYRVLRVDSQFSRGQFTQTLDLIRMPDALPEVPKPVASPIVADSAADGSRVAAFGRSALANAPGGTTTNNTDNVPPAVPPALETAANQPPVVSPVVNSGDGNPQATPIVDQAAPQNANNAQNVAPQNTAGWTFADAFRQARKDFGNRPGGSFEWRGRLYQTNYQNEPFVTNPVPVYPGANQ